MYTPPAIRTLPSGTQAGLEILLPIPMIALPTFIPERFMPIYEYQCDACAHKFEVMQRMSDDRLKTCPACNTDNLRKLISPVGFQLKGTGWYETDFKNSGKPQETSSSGSKSESKSESKSDSSAKTEKKTSESTTKSD